MSPQPLIVAATATTVTSAVKILRATALRNPRTMRLALPACGIVMLMAAFFALPLPSVIHTVARIVPTEEWILAKGSDGQLIASTFNHEKGLSDGYRVSNFSRGSSVIFTVRARLAPGLFVATGDTLGSIFSSEMQERLIALQGELITARNSLAVSASGEKAAVVRAAEQRLASSKRRQQEHAVILQRSQALIAGALISQNEFEAVQSRANAIADEIQIDTANLEAARSGAKPEQQALVHARIAAIKNEIAIIENREAAYTLTAPISGVISRTFSADTLLRIADTRTYVALIPVRWTDYSRLAATSEPAISASGLARTEHVTLSALNPEVQVLNFEKVVTATAVLPDCADNFLPGMVVKCNITCARATVFARVRRHLRNHAVWGHG